MPVAEEAGGSAVLHNQLYVFGGASPFITTQIYNPGNNTWSFGPDMNVYRFRFYGTAVGNHSIVALGGQGNTGRLCRTESRTRGPATESESAGSNAPPPGS